MRNISQEEYQNLTVDFLAYTGEQWLQNGVNIIFELDCDENYYYLTVEVASNVYDFFEEYPDCDRSSLNETEKFCEEFSCKACNSLDEVNYIIRQHLPDYCEFEQDEDGNIYGN